MSLTVMHLESLACPGWWFSGRVGRGRRAPDRPSCLTNAAKFIEIGREKGFMEMQTSQNVIKERLNKRHRQDRIQFAQQYVEEDLEY